MDRRLASFAPPLPELEETSRGYLFVVRSNSFGPAWRKSHDGGRGLGLPFVCPFDLNGTGLRRENLFAVLVDSAPTPSIILEPNGEEERGRRRQLERVYG